MSDISLKILLQAQNQTSGVFSGLANSLQNVAFGFRNLSTDGTIGMGALMQGASGLGTAFLSIAAGAALVGTAVAVGIGVASVKAAADYQQSMNSVQALTGSTQAQMAQYDTGLKQLAVDAGVAPTALSKGLYNVLSASYSGATAMRVLTLATEDSKIGMTSAAVTTDALTNILRSFSVQDKDVTRVNGEMLQTVTLGKATFDQYATTIVKAASASTQFHVSMETMNAAWATMTSSGIRAAQASTDYQASLKVMYGNIGTVTASLHKNGIAFDEAKFNSMSYGDKVVYLNHALDEANSKHVKVTGVTLQAAQAIQTISKHIGDYHHNLDILSNKQSMAQKTQQAWAITQGGFNQSMDRVKASIQVLLINIGEKLLPTLTRLAQQVTPIIVAFANWIAKSGVVENTMNAVVGAIGKMVQAGVALVNFFKNNELAMDALKVTLVVLAVVIGVVMVIALYNMAVAAWAAMLPFLPIIAIILAVIVVITLIVYAVQHWGQIAHWLQGVWAAFSSWFMSAMGAVGNFFHGIWEAIVNWFKSAWNAVINWFKGIWSGITGAVSGAFNTVKTAIGNALTNTRNTIVNIVNGIVSWLKNAWQNAVNAVVQSFVWLYNHNYYFKDLVDGIRIIVTTIINWLKMIWTNDVNVIVSLWNWLKNAATTAWNAVVNAITNVVNTVVTWLKMIWTNDVTLLRDVWNLLKGYAEVAWNAVVAAFHAIIDPIIAWLQSVWQTAVTAVQTQWNRLAGLAQSAWSAVTSVFRDAWSGISGALSSLWANISNWFNGIVGQMAQFGSNMIQSFINGINSMLGAVGNAASGIADKVKSFLGFHSPAKEGPGKELMQWPVNMVKSYAAVLSAQTPVMTAAVNTVAQAFLGLEHTAEHRGRHRAPTHHTPTQHHHKAPVQHPTRPTSGLGPVYAPTGGGISGGSSGGLSGGSSGGYTIGTQYNMDFTINITPNAGSSRQQAREIADMVEAELTKRFRQQGSYTTTSSGGSAL